MANRIKIICPLIDEVSSILDKNLKSLSREWSDYDKYALILMHNYLERFTYCLKTIPDIIYKLEDDVRYETSIGLILRASLLDYLHLIHLSRSFKNKDGINELKIPKVIDECKAILGDNIKYWLTSYKDFEKKKLISIDQYKSNILFFYNNFSEFFQEFNEQDGSYKLKNINGFKVKEIFNSLMADELRNTHSDVYVLYDIYSKYDHFGIVTDFLQQIPFSQRINNILSSIFYLISGSIMLLYIFDFQRSTNEDINRLLDLQNKLNQL